MLKKIFPNACLAVFLVVLSSTSFAKEASPWNKGDLSRLNSYFDKYCYSCHGIDSRERGGIELESMKFDISNRQNLYFWSRVHEVIKTGEMPPPKKKKQPSKLDKKKILSTLGKALYKADSKIERQMERRLSNKEIENVLIDVFGTYLHSESYFGDSEGISGFDNQYTDLQISSGFMINYNKFIDVALEHFFSPEKSTAYTKTNVFIDNGMFINKGHNRNILQGGKYRFTINFKDFPELKDHQAYVRVESASGELSHPQLLDLKKSRELTLETVLNPGSRFQIVTTVSKKNKKFNDLRRLKSLNLEGPLNQQNIFTELTSCKDVTKMTLDNGKKLLSSVLPLLYGRPAPAEINAYKRTVKEGQSPLEASKISLKKALLSIEFLYGIDIRAGKSASDLAIANRMARVLWRSIPDKALLELAAQKKLSDPKVRRKQTLQMMKDSRFQRFKDTFFASWLGSGDFYKKENPTEDYFPKFQQQGKMAVLWSLYEQHHLYVNDIMDNNRSIIDLVSSDWTYANDLISKNYGLPTKGLDKKLTKVKLPKNSIRGGILTQGVFARLTSSVNDTSPVKRGVWILENIMATHIPSPPQVEGFEPNTVGATSVKEQFLKHREHKACASCHNKIDPIGFLFETLDPLGEERSVYAKSNKVKKKKGKKKKDKTVKEDSKLQPIDTSSLSFKGNAFNNLNDFKKYLRDNSEETIVKSYMYKLAMYTFGREKDFTDKYRIQKLIRADKTNFKAKNLLIEFICSSLFIK